MVLASPASLLGEGFDELEYLGRGGYGVVYRGVDVRLGRVVALKVLSSHNPSETTRALGEASAQAAVSHQDHILALYDARTTPEGTPYLVLEYAAGGSLQDRVERDGPLSAQQWHRLGAELSAALAGACAMGVAHCDVKPSNVLFSAEGAVRLADFGTARNIEITADTADHFEGSIAYAAPEVLDGEKPGFAGDMYGLALTLWFAATGRRPFGAGSSPPAAVFARIQTESIAFDELPFAVSDTLRESLQRCAGREPRNRPDPSALTGQFDDPPDAPQVIPPGRPRRRSGRRSGRRTTWRTAVLAMTAALLGSLLTLSVAPEADTTNPDRAAARLPSEAALPDKEDFCGSFESTMDARKQLLNDVSNELEQGQSPTAVVRQVLVGYPTKASDILYSFLSTTRSFSQQSRVQELTKFQLSQLSLAEALRSLTGGKPFLFDGQDGSFDPATLPTDLRIPALTVSDAYRLAVDTCPEVQVDLSPAKARMSSAVFSTLTDERFMADFYADPESAELMTTPTVMLITSMSWGFTDALLVSHLEWFFNILDSDDELLSAVAFEHPDIILAAVANEPTLERFITQPRWIEHLRLGLDHATPSEKVGMNQLYGAQLQMIGLADP